MLWSLTCLSVKVQNCSSDEKTDDLQLHPAVKKMIHNVISGMQRESSLPT